MMTEKALLRAVWLKALEDGGVAILYETLNDAIRMRLKLYGAVKQVRENPFDDPPLHAAAKECEIIIDKQPDGKALLKVRPSLQNPLLKAASLQLGIPLVEPIEETLDEAESIRRLEARLHGLEENPDE